MRYFYGKLSKPGAKDLMLALNAKPIGRFDGLSFSGKTTLEEGDVIICWGKAFPKLDNITVINANSGSSADTVTEKLQHIIPILPTYDGLKNLTGHEGYVFHHPDETAYYITTRYNGPEYKLHVINGKIVKTGQKVIKQGFTSTTDLSVWKSDMNTYAHPTFKSHKTGWETSYAGIASNTIMRKTAKIVANTLELDFAVVNLVDVRGRLYLRPDVDIAPDLTPDMVKLYSKSLNDLIDGNVAPVGVEDVL